jgi:hypothetical protein
VHAPIAGCCKYDGDCKHADPCQEGKCNGSQTCEYRPKKCDDGNACTDDKCEGGKCVNKPKNCDDNNKCTTDTCDPKTGACKNIAVVCDDKNPYVPMSRRTSCFFSAGSHTGRLSLSSCPHGMYVLPAAL